MQVGSWTRSTYNAQQPNLQAQLSMGVQNEQPPKDGEST